MHGWSSMVSRSSSRRPRSANTPRSSRSVDGARFKHLRPTPRLPVTSLRAEFFTRFGLYVEREFLSRPVCASLMEEMRAGAGTPATVAEGQAGDAVDDAYRRTKQAEVSVATAARISEQL